MRHLNLESLESRTLLAAGSLALIQDSVSVPRAPAEAACTIAHPGDANCDRVFDSSDLVLMMQSAQYEDDVQDNSDWSDGDFDGDGDFTSSDLVMAFQTGTYETSHEEVEDSACKPLVVSRLPLFGGFLTFLRGRTDSGGHSGRSPESDDLFDTLAQCRSTVGHEQPNV